MTARPAAVPAPRPGPPPARALALLLALGCALAAGGCRSSPGPDAGPDAAQPARSAPGLELAWWIVRDPAGDHLGRVLGGLPADAATVPDQQALDWAAAGLRLVPTSADRLPALREALRVVPPVRTQRLPDAPGWTPIASGVPWSATRAVTAGPDTLSLPPGRLRLLARAWIAPDAGSPGPDGAPAARLRVELVPQHEPQAAAPDEPESIEQRLGLRPRPTAEQAGLTLSGLSLPLALRSGQALLIVPERPERRWSGWERAAAAPPTPATPQPAGPAVPAGLTVGELLLTDWPATLTDTPADLRVILVLSASTPDTFRLIGQ